MAFGGGEFIAQNKVLPGTYINFVSVARATATLSDRGYVTMPLALDWGPEDEVFTVYNEDFQKSTQKVFGYPYTHESMKGLRDLFMNAKVLYAYRLNNGGEKASNDYAMAKYPGIRGNDLKITIKVNVDDDTQWDVITYFGIDKVDSQTVANVKELDDNDYVKFKKFELAAVSGAALSGGTNGEITGTSYQNYLDKIESYAYNTMGVVTTDEIIKRLYVSFNKRLRDEMGIKFQLVLYQYPKADYLGVISIKNKCVDGVYKDDTGKKVYPDEAAAVYWTTGAEGGCKVNASVQNRAYDGEYTVEANYTQAELIAAIKAGEFVFHSVNEDVRVLDDINTMVSTTDTFGDVFKDNQTIRVCDQIANDDALVFANKYIGRVPNDDPGRNALWMDLVKINNELQKLRAIENFKDTDVIVYQGDTKKAVVVEMAVTPVNAMSKLYMTVTIY